MIPEGVNIGSRDTNTNLDSIAYVVKFSDSQVAVLSRHDSREQFNYDDSKGFLLILVSYVTIWEKDETAMKLVDKEFVSPNCQKRLRKTQK